MTVNMHEAKTNLSKLIMLLEKGEDIVIAKAGNPVAKLVAYVAEPKDTGKLEQFRKLRQMSNNKKAVTMNNAIDTNEMVDDGLF